MPWPAGRRAMGWKAGPSAVQAAASRASIAMRAMRTFIYIPCARTTRARRRSSMTFSLIMRMQSDDIALPILWDVGVVQTIERLEAIVEEERCASAQRIFKDRPASLFV